jgi:DnaJ-class molecular chaperone
MGRYNPYRVLGVEPQATRGDIRRAYHQLALRHHPDAAGPREAERFVEIVDAYELLSDPDARADYDQAHLGYAARRRQERFAAPLALALFDVAGSLLRGALESIDLIEHGFVHEGQARSDEDVLHYDLALSRQEAARGGRFDFRVPVRRRCRACAPVARPYCRACGGEGFIVDEPEIELLVPPGVSDGARAVLSLGRLGVAGGRVDVTVRIE